jgi:hypothetical protein
VFVFVKVAEKACEKDDVMTRTGALARHSVGFAAACCIYPLALLIVLLCDTAVGESEFVRSWLDSGRATVMTILRDWAAALPMTLATWYFLRGIGAVLRARKIRPGILPITAAVIVVVLVMSAFFPPYVPLIFGAILLVAAALGAGYDAHWRSTPQ